MGGAIIVHSLLLVAAFADLTIKVLFRGRGRGSDRLRIGVFDPILSPCRRAVLVFTIPRPFFDHTGIFLIGTALSGSGLSKDGLIWESDVVEADSLDGGEGENGEERGEAHCERFFVLYY